jgi:hypothetical protein
MPLVDALTALGAVALRDVARRERWQVQSTWRQAFAPGVNDWSGDLAQFDWHAFSCEVVGHLKGAAAIVALGRAVAGRLIVAQSLPDGPMLRCELAALPDYTTLRNAWPGDLYLMNDELEWTFVMTHEPQCGPYFAERVFPTTLDSKP